jgi:hypothetical protein
MRSTHSDRLARWLGPDADRISQAMRGWYGPPIIVGNTPGRVYAMPDGDFCGPIRAGQVSSLVDFTIDRIMGRIRRFTKAQQTEFHTGFANFGDLLSEATAGKLQVLPFNKALNTQVTAGVGSSWRVGVSPVAGAASSAAPGGRALTSGTAGALPFVNASGGDTLHYVSDFVSNTGSGTILMYDRLFDVLKTMASTSTEAVTGVPTRYQGSTAGAADYPAGNFVFVEVGGTALSATVHNWTVCKYTNQAGTTGQTFASMAGNSSAITDRLDHTLGSWYLPLASGDSGVKALTQMQCDQSITGVILFVVGHPLAWMPTPTAVQFFAHDGVQGAFNPVRIFDNACLTFLNVMPPATTASVLTGTVNVCAG